MTAADLTPADLTAADLEHLRRCIALAAEALDAGDAPFGSVLVAADGAVLAEDRNRENTEADFSAHPEFTLARWAFQHLAPDDRAAATVYTSGEHCPMCSAAHGWAGLGRIVFVSSGEQTAAWRAALGEPSSPVAVLGIREVVPGIEVVGPVAELEHDIRALHEEAHRRAG